MRSFFMKIFVCMVMVPVLGCGGGLLLQATLNNPQPGIERLYRALAPSLAALAAEDVARDGAAGVRAALRRAGGLFELRATSAAGCTAGAGAARAVPVGGTGYCLVPGSLPRPLILGFIPDKWVFLMPALEMLCCAAISFFLARYLAEPIRRTRAAAAAFAGGNMAARASRAPGPRCPRARDVHPRRDEAADLAREFDCMADRISAMIEAQHRFIGDVSHEIRSPLARLAMALGLLRREVGPTLDSRLDRMEAEIGSISTLVRELLALASLQGALDPPEPVTVDLALLLGQVIEDMTFEFRERAHAIRVIRPPGPALVSGDRAWLRRAVENVLRNALFYTPEATSVEAVLERDAGWVRLVVRDKGPGVPEAALGDLFRPFFRVDEARARNTGGAGLGLAITSRAIELHGGRIEAVNVYPHGLAIRIELPEAREPAGVAQDGGSGAG